MDNKKIAIFLEVKVKVPEGYAVYFQEQAQPYKQGLTSLQPLRMETLEKDKWFLEIDQDSYLKTPRALDYLVFKLFIANEDNSNDLLINQDKLLDSGERQIMLYPLKNGGILRKEYPLLIDQFIGQKYEENNQISIKEKLLKDKRIKQGILILLIPFIILWISYPISTGFFIIAVLIEELVERQKREELVNKQIQEAEKKERLDEKQKKEIYMQQQQAAKQVIKEIFQSKNNEPIKIKSEQVKAVIVPYLKELNPQADKIDDSQIKVFAQYRATQNLTEKKPEEVKQMEEESQKTLQEIQQTCQNKDIKQKDNSCEIAVAGLYNMYKNKGFNVQLTKSKVNLSEEDQVADAYQSQMILTGQTENLKYLDLRIQDSDQLSFEKIENDAYKKKEFIENFLEAAAKQYNVSKDQIKIIDVCKGSIQVKYKLTSLDETELDNLVKKGNEVFERHFGSVTLGIRSFVENFQIRPDMFDPNYNMYWGDSFSNQKDYRGGFKLPDGKYEPQMYKFPVGYHGYGLNVQKLLIKDQEWLKSDSSPTTWIVLFHGTHADAVNAITYDNFKSGYRNAYGGHTCRLSGKIIKQGDYQNTYFSDDVKECEGYVQPVQIGSKNYIFVFQCRVNPQHVRSPEDRPEYYTVEEEFVQDNVRPYRILVKDV